MSENKNEKDLNGWEMMEEFEQKNNKTSNNSTEENKAMEAEREELKKQAQVISEANAQVEKKYQALASSLNNFDINTLNKLSDLEKKLEENKKNQIELGKQLGSLKFKEEAVSKKEEELAKKEAELKKQQEAVEKGYAMRKVVQATERVITKKIKALEDEKNALISLYNFRINYAQAELDAIEEIRTGSMVKYYEDATEELSAEIKEKAEKIFEEKMKKNQDNKREFKIYSENAAKKGENVSETLEGIKKTSFENLPELSSETQKIDDIYSIDI